MSCLIMKDSCVVLSLIEIGNECLFYISLFILPQERLLVLHNYIDITSVMCNFTKNTAAFYSLLKPILALLSTYFSVFRFGVILLWLLCLSSPSFTSSSLLRGSPDLGALADSQPPGVAALQHPSEQWGVWTVKCACGR